MGEVLTEGDSLLGLRPHDRTYVPQAKPALASPGTCHGHLRMENQGLSRACIPSRSASRTLAPATVTVAAWTEEEARVRASLASWHSWRGKREAGWVALQRGGMEGLLLASALPSPLPHPTPHPQVTPGQPQPPPGLLQRT